MCTDCSSNSCLNGTWCKSSCTSTTHICTNTGATRIGRYAECTVTNTDDFTVPGDWSTGTFYIGYLYEYSVKFPRFYVQQTDGKVTQSDINSKLTIHRAKINFGKIGLYETTLKRVGKLDYTEIYESALSTLSNPI